MNEITDSVSSAVDAVDTVTSAPMELVNNVTSRVRSAFKPKRASDESVALGREKAADATVGDAVKSVAKGTAAVAGAAVADQREHMAEQRAEREEKAAAKRAAAEKTSEAAASMTDAVMTAAASDADAATRYSTYEGGAEAAPAGAKAADSVSDQDKPEA